MTASTLFQAAQAGGAAVLVTGQRKKKARSEPPGLPPDDPDRGRDGGGGGGDDAGGRASSSADGAGSFALALAMIGITTLFAVLIVVWLFLRRPAPDWQGAGAPGALDALWISSACLLLSSATVERAARFARAGRERRRATLCWLCASALLGLVFVAAQVQLWTTLWRAGLVPSASGYAAVFFALTGLHALHVLGGLGFLGTLVLQFRGALHAIPNASSVRLCAVYWHFMGMIWLVLFTLLYFVR